MPAKTPVAEHKPVNGAKRAPFSAPAPVPSFQNKRARLYVGDATETMGGLSRHGAFADSVIADPPFNYGQQYGGGAFQDAMPEVEYQEFTRRWIVAACRAVRPGGSIFVNVPDPVVAYAYVCLATAGMKFVNWIILSQEFGQYNESKFITGHVHLLYFVKPGGERTWNLADVLEPSARLEMGDPRIETSKHKGMRPMLDVWAGPNSGRVQGNNEERWNPHLHPNQLPELYVARVIRCATNPGDVVLDCFAGSGTSGVVATALGRKWVGIELIPESAASGWERITVKGPVRDVAGVLHCKNVPVSNRRGVNLSRM